MRTLGPPGGIHDVWHSDIDSGGSGMKDGYRERGSNTICRRENVSKKGGSKSAKR